MINRIPHIAVIATVLSLSAVSAQEAQDEPRQYQSQALSYYLDGDLLMMQEEYAGAIVSYTQALKYDSTSATIFLALGEALIKQGQPHKAYAAGLKAEALEPTDPFVHEFMAEAAAQSNKLDQAVAYLDTWYKYDPTNLEPMFRKAGVMIQLKRYDEAIDTYLAIYEIDSNQEQVLARAGEIAMSVKDFERSFSVFSRLKMAKPGDLRILVTYAELCVRTNRSDLAIDAYEAIIATGHASPGQQIQLAWLYKQTDKGPAALKILMGLIDAGHRQWEVMRMSAITASELAEFSSLTKIADLMIQVYPDSADGYTAKAIAENSLGNPQRAIDALELGHARVAPDVDVNYLLGNLYYSVQRTVEAEEHLRVAHELEPKAREIRQMLAAAWSDLKRFQESDSLYEALIAENGEEAVSLNNYAYSLAERDIVTKKQLKRAAKLSKKSLKLKSDNASFLDTYGWILYRTGKIKKAKKYVSRSLAINANSIAVLEHMAILLRHGGDEAGAKNYDQQADELRQSKELAKAKKVD